MNTVLFMWKLIEILQFQGCFAKLILAVYMKYIVQPYNVYSLLAVEGVYNLSYGATMT